MTQDEQIQQLKEQHDKLQESIKLNPICIREGLVFFLPEGDYPRFGFEHFTWRNPPCVRELDLFMKYANGKKFFWDIGAFHGIFSLVFDRVNPEARTLAIEPNPSAFSTLVQTVSMNTGRAYLSNTALSDHNGKVQMKEQDGHYVQDENGTGVECVQGDFLVNKFPNPPDILKIDVEGAELEVLEGLYGVIAKNHPIIFLELHLTELSKRSVDKIHEMLIEKWRYKILDTETEHEISLTEIHNKQGEIRLICL